MFFILKYIRKIGKTLRAGAGKKEIFLGTLCGVLIGFNPVAGLTLALIILITLLLNANIHFTLLGAAIGKLLALAMAPLSFHTGHYIIHSIGAEDLFARLANAPVTALMDLDVYAMSGGLLYALIIGIILGALFAKIVNKTRQKMLETEQHEVVGKNFWEKTRRCLMRLAFGKKKLSLEEMIAKPTKLFRKSGLILVGCVILIGLLGEFLLLDTMFKSGLKSAIQFGTGAQVDIAKAHLSLTKGTLEVQGLQVTDPDNPTHNLMQIDRLAADISIHDLLCNNYVINQLTGSTVRFNTLRAKPGTVFEKEEPLVIEEEKAPGEALEYYFSKAQVWQKYGRKAHDFLKTCQPDGTEEAQNIEAARTQAKKRGYLKASANLVADRPVWTIRRSQIENIRIGEGLPLQTFEAKELSSHPALNRKPIEIALNEANKKEPTLALLLRTDVTNAPHALVINLNGAKLANSIETTDNFPMNLRDGTINLKANGTFSIDELALPFSITVNDLKAHVEDGRKWMGMDAATANEVLSSIEQLTVDGQLAGSLLLPRVQVDYDKLTAHLREALVAAGKKELAQRADQGLDKAKEMANKELDKATGAVDKELDKAKSKGAEALKKLF